MSEAVSVERRGRVAHVVLSRPEKLNALDLSAWSQLGDVVGRLGAEADLRCLVLRGEGDRAFSAGADIAAFPSERSDPARARRYGEVVAATMAALRACAHPTLAMIRGACVGGGLEVASVCDLRIAAASSRFGIPVARLGVTMAHAELRGLLAVVGPAAALEILLEGEVFGAERAKDLGLVHRVVADGELEAEVEAAAGRIAAGAPLVHRWHKRFIRRLADPRPLEAGEVDEAWAFAATDDFAAGVRAFLDRRKPEFQGR
jgi:enoyl-CoA hydratase